jgi:hypothetical protein
VVEYQVDAAEPRRAELKQAWGLLSKKMINPSEGSMVPLLLDRGSGTVRFDVKNPAINWKANYNADESKRHARFDEKLRG